jgi:dTDP-D-glucose 4,6-dehydratase
VIAHKIIDEYLNHDHNLYDYGTFIDGNIKRRGQDVRYAINDDKIKALGWRPQADFDTKLKDIVAYYVKNFIW